MGGVNSRSSNKGFYISEGVIRALDRNEKNPSSLIKIWDRASQIIPRFVGKSVHVYNGKKFVQFTVSEAHVLHRFGEFSPTKALVKHSGKKAKENKKK